MKTIILILLAICYTVFMMVGLFTDDTNKKIDSLFLAIVGMIAHISISIINF